MGKTTAGAREAADSAVMLWAVGRFAGLIVFFDSDPGAGAPGFMLPPASRASICLVGDPGAGAPGFMLPPASRAKRLSCKASKCGKWT